MFNPSRNQARLFFIDAWRKHREGALLTPLEDIAARILLDHPEYHELLEDAETSLRSEWTPEHGQTNPFLHLGLHLAIAEQLSIDQPPGIRAAFEALRAHHANVHDALHVILDCLGETVWRSQRAGLPPDGDAYLECVRRKAG